MLAAVLFLFDVEDLSAPKFLQGQWPNPFEGENAMESLRSGIPLKG